MTDAALRERVHSVLRAVGEGGLDPGTGSDYGDQAAAVMTVILPEINRRIEQVYMTPENSTDMENLRGREILRLKQNNSDLTSLNSILAQKIVDLKEDHREAHEGETESTAREIDRAQAAEAVLGRVTVTARKLMETGEDYCHKAVEKDSFSLHFLGSGIITAALAVLNQINVTGEEK